MGFWRRLIIAFRWNFNLKVVYNTWLSHSDLFFEGVILFIALLFLLPLQFVVVLFSPLFTLLIDPIVTAIAHNDRKEFFEQAEKKLKEKNVKEPEK